MGLLSGHHMRPFWGCPYGLVRMGPIWVLYGRAFKGKPVYSTHGVHIGLLTGVNSMSLFTFL